MLAPPPPPPPPRAFSAPPPPEPATATPRGGGVRLFQSRVVATPTVTNKQAMRPAGTPRHDGMAAAKEVIFGGQASWLARGSGTPRLTQPPRGSRTAAAARKHMRSDVDEVVFGRDMDRSSGAEAVADDSVIRDADLADGIRPAGGKPAISAKAVRGKVRARRAPLPDTLRSHRRSLLRTSAPRRPTPRPAAHPPFPKALSPPEYPPSPCDLPGQMINPNLEATTFSVIFSAPQQPALALGQQAADVRQGGRGPGVPAGQGNRWGQGNDPLNIDMWRSKGRGSSAEALVPTGLVVGDSGANAMDSGFRSHGTLAHRTEGAAPQERWARERGAREEALREEGSPQQTQLRKASFLEATVKRKGAPPAAAQDRDGASFDVAAMGSHARAAVFGHPLPCERRSVDAILQGGGHDQAAPPASPMRRALHGAAGVRADGLLGERGGSGAPQTPRAAEGEREARCLPPACRPPEAPACRPPPACRQPATSLSPASRQPLTSPAACPRHRQVFDVDGDATHRGHRLSNGGAAAALTAALAPGSVARVVFGGGGAEAAQEAAEAPGSAARVAGAAGVAHDTHQGQKHPSRPQLIESYAQHVHSGALHAYAPDDEAGTARVTNSETHAASADPVERRRERGRRQLPRQEGAVSQLFTASEYPEPPPQRWDDSTFERRLKGDVHRHHRQYIEAPSRSQLRQLSRAVGGGGRPAERMGGPRSPYNAARSKSRWTAG